MKIQVLSSLLLPSFLLLSSCDRGEDAQDKIPQTAAEMYAKAEALLKPHIEGEASDFEGALLWTRRAAEAGYLKAQTDLAGLYLEGGKGVEKDRKLAYDWFVKAAAQGNAQSEFFLGDILYQGCEGLAADAAAAMKHWEIAAAKGLPEAKQRLGRIYSKSVDTVERGLLLLEEAAKAKMALAAKDLGFIYARGQSGIKSDMEKSAHWYRVAADLGDAEALYIFALMELDGEHVQQNVNHALSFLRLSAGQDYKPAMAMLVNMLRLNDTDEYIRKEADAWEKRLKELNEK